MTICVECKHCVDAVPRQCSAPSLERFCETIERDPVTGVQYRAAWGIGIHRIFAPLDGHFNCCEINDGNCPHFEAKS